MIRLEDSILYICFCVGISYCLVTNHVRFARYLEQENRNDDRFNLSSSTGASLDECAGLCMSSPDCESFFFRQSDGSCELKTVLYINQSDTTEDQGTAYYYAVKDGWCPSSTGYVSDSSATLCLRFYNEGLTWYDANGVCSNGTLSSRLVVIDDAAKFELVKTIALSEGITSNVFFFGMQETSNDVYTWVDGSNLSFTPTWHTSYLSTPELQDCVGVHVDTWKWVKVPCNVTQKFICELTSDKKDYDKMMML